LRLAVAVEVVALFALATADASPHLPRPELHVMAVVRFSQPLW
jgi:hypothetical protein